MLEACLITEVREWGEMITAIRIEYSEEIWSGSVSNYICHAQNDYYHLPNKDVVFSCTYRVDSSMFCIDSVYVNNSGIKNEASYYGKFVFLNLAVTNSDPLLYKDRVTFHSVPHCSDPKGGLFPSRPKLPPILVHQLAELKTKNGDYIERGAIDAYREIRLIVDDFKTFTYGDKNGKWINYHVYIPDGYQTPDETKEKLPLVIFYPSGQARTVDYTGRYMGAVFTNYYCTMWASPENQKEHPSFVMTIGGDYPYMDWGDQENYEHSWVQQYYVAAIKDVCSRYNVDTERVYACSSGGGGGALWQTAAANEGLFAAQIIAANDFYSPGGLRNEERGHRLMLEQLRQMKCWWVTEELDSTGLHALSDDDPRLRGDFLRDQAEVARKAGYKIDITNEEQMWNGYLRGDEAAKLVTDQIARSEDADARISFLIPGTVRIDKHCGGNAFYANKGLRDWMYTNRSKFHKD